MPRSDVEDEIYEALLAVSEEDDWGLRDLASHADVTEDGFGMQLCERCLNRLEAEGRVEWVEGTWRPVDR